MTSDNHPKTIRLVRIDKMSKADVPRVMEIELASFTSPWHESAYLSEINNRSAYYIVARLEDKIVGYAGMWVIMDEAHITTIAVAPECRGMRIGEQILIALLEESIRRGALRATLEVRMSNKTAQNLYLKYGFSPVAIRRGYYSDNNEDALVMWIDDMCSPQYQKMFKNHKQQLIEECEEYNAQTNKVAG